MIIFMVNCCLWLAFSHGKALLASIIYHLKLIVVIIDMCMHNAVESHNSSLAIFRCLPFSHLVYTRMILSIMMFVGGN